MRQAAAYDWPVQLYERLKPLERPFYQALSQSSLWHLDEITKRYPNKWAKRTAIDYALNNRHKFTAFLSHPDLPINNNPWSWRSNLLP
jgi:hypothetical protein